MILLEKLCFKVVFKVLFLIIDESKIKFLEEIEFIIGLLLLTNELFIDWIVWFFWIWEIILDLFLSLETQYSFRSIDLEMNLPVFELNIYSSNNELEKSKSTGSALSVPEKTLKSNPST